MTTQYILPITSDWHVGDRFGLCPPVVTLEQGTYRASKFQSAIYRAWVSYWSIISDYKSQLNATVVAPALGDLGDLNKYSKSDLFTTVPADVEKAIQSVLIPTQGVVDHWVIVRGTEAHSGAAGELEEWLASDLDNAARFSPHTASWYVWKAQLNGVRLHCAHTLPSGTKIVANRGNAVSSSCRNLHGEYDAAGEPKPHLAFWGHRHWYAPGYSLGIQGYSVSSWGGLNSFARGIGLSIPGPIQTPILFIPGLGGQAWSIELFERKLPRQKLWTPDSLAP